MDEILFARTDDMIRNAEDGVPSYSGFLNEAEAAALEAYLKRQGVSARHDFWGGYKNPGRKRLFIYPDYYELRDISDCIVPLRLKGSGYEKLTHSDFLGALMNLGVDRSKLGDIIVDEDMHSAILFADEAIASFLLSEPSPLTRVARDKVRILKADLPEDFERREEYKGIFATVSSPRLDAVISALTGTAREKSKAAIDAGQVFVNYAEEHNYSRNIIQGDIITVRGNGKYIIDSLCDKTKKDRFKLQAKKYT